jgi:hypothetical protein
MDQDIMDEGKQLNFPLGLYTQQVIQTFYAA